MLKAAPRPPRQSFLEGPSTVFWVAVVAWTCGWGEWVGRMGWGWGESESCAESSRVSWWPANVERQGAGAAAAAAALASAEGRLGQPELEANMVGCNASAAPSLVACGLLPAAACATCNPQHTQRPPPLAQQ